MGFAAVCLGGQAAFAADERPAHLGRVHGVITAELPLGLPIRIGLAQRFDDFLGGRLVRDVVVPGPGPFELVDVPAGRYAIAALVDLNSNGRWDWEVDAYAVQRALVVVSPGADVGPVVLAAFANAVPRFPLSPSPRDALLAQARFLYQGASAFARNPLEPARRRTARALQSRLRNVLHWAQQPGTVDQHRYLFAEVATAAAGLQEIANGGNPATAERGPVRRAVFSTQFGAPWPYALYIPPSYTADRAWPLFIALHGAGGNADNMLRTVCGAGRWGHRVQQGREPFPPFPEREAFVLCPYGLTTDNPFDGYQANVEEVLASLDAVQADFAIDPGRVYVLGVSMGGGGAWRLGLTYPDRFAAIAPVSGTLPLPVTNAGDAPELPVIVVHGAHDQVIPIDEVRRYVASRKAAGGRVELREFADGGHALAEFELAGLFADLERAAGNGGAQ